MIRYLLSTFFLLSTFLAAENYRPPNMEKELFDAKKIELNSITRTALFSALISVARDFDSEKDSVDYDLRSNALAIAGRLDPESQTFKDVSEDLKSRGRTVKDDNASKSAVSAQFYRALRTLMRKVEQEDTKKCASFCLDIALRFDPESKDAKKFEEYLTETGKPSWDDMLEAPVYNNPWDQQQGNEFKKRTETIPGGSAEKFAASQRSVYGLAVRTLANGRHAGAASSLSATALRESSVTGIEFHIDQKVGNMTGNSLEEIKKLMRIRHEDAGRIPSGYRIEIAFDDKDTLLDGPSAGTAMSIILDSLFTGLELDDAFAVTGAITADGKVTRIGGVAGKIRGATRKNCTLVGVPDDNIAGVYDILVLDGIQKLIDIQVFSFKTLDDALKVAAKEKPTEVQETIDTFSKIAVLIKEKGESALSSPAVVSLLEDVVKKMPNHQSAQILLSVAKGSQKTALSIGGSLHEIDTNTAGISRNIQKMIWSEEAIIETSEKEDAQDALATIEKLGEKLDPRLKDYHKAIIETLTTYTQGRKSDEKDEDFIKRIETSWEELSRQRKKLMEDPEIMEELMG